MKSNFEERKQRRLEACQRLAAKNELLSNSLYKRASVMASVIPFGQPILVGHHSEGRDRNYRNKIHNTFGKSFEAGKKAEYYERKAETIENGTAISSDDPNAISKLEEKLASLQKNQETMKACNKILKSKKSDAEKVAEMVAIGLKEATAVKLLQPDCMGRIGFASYSLSNNNANIRTVKQRIQQLSKLASIQTTEHEINGVILKISAEDNRVQLFFPGKPSEEIRAELKRNGFRWSPQVGAWMRQISTYAVYIAKEIISKIPVAKSA